MVKKISLVLSVCFFSILIYGQKFPSANYLPLVEKQSNHINISIKPLKARAIFFLHYRTEGMNNFQIRKMHVNSSGVVCHQIFTENLYGKNMEYFIVEKAENGTESISLTHTITNFTQNKSPEIYFG